MMNKLYERVLRVVHNDDINNLETLLHKRNDMFSHHRDIQTLMTEIYKIEKEFPPPFMGSMLNKGNVTCNSFSQKEIKLFFFMFQKHFAPRV